jgi:hypothetical protein
MAVSPLFSLKLEYALIDRQPIIAMFANFETSSPVYTSGALFIVAGLLVVILPFEPQGKASL